ncbi:fasciclin domain-containing protein [Mucilaginibacter sp. HD30]
MKLILLGIVFCAVINTAAAQNQTPTPIAVKNRPDELMDPKKDIPANILALQQSSIFLRSLDVSGLTQTFNNPGPLTVFLPADSAFNKLSPGMLDALLTPKKKHDLISLITYHVLPGKVSAKNIAKEIGRGKGLAVFRTLSGASLKAQFDESGNIILIDEAGGKSTIQKSDLKQHNGLIHLVSAALIPKIKQI